MQIAQLIIPERVGFHIEVSSKKRALEVLSELFASSCKGSEEIRDTDILEKLISRERLGTTGFGHGVAIPHGRLTHLEDAVIAVLVLEQPIDFDALDGQPVDIMISLLVPEEATDEHLQLLALIAAKLRDATIVNRLREAKSREAILAIIEQWHDIAA